MSLYRVAAAKLEPVAPTTFAEESLLERKDLQRLLRQNISPVGDDLLVVAEEFGDWEDSNRRIDLLCLSKEASLVVVEIKRTEDGGHMELQAVRYAAMVSSMTLEQVVHAYAQGHQVDESIARNDILSFLQADSEDETELSGEVRIVLVSADFGSELTTTVLWLNRHDLDIACIRLRPYRMGSEVLIDVTQIIPLPESTDYEVKVRAQEKEKRKVSGLRQETLRKFWKQLIERSRSKTTLYSSRNTTADSLLGVGIGRTGIRLNLSVNKDESTVACYINFPSEAQRSKEAFCLLQQQQDSIHKAFGSELTWQALEGSKGCQIYSTLPGGWKTPDHDWPELHDRMIDCLVRLESALRQPIENLNL